MTCPYPQLVFFGDSLLEQSVRVQEGFSMQAALQSLVIRRLDVVNRGFSGWNTKNAVEYLPEIFPGTPSGSPKMAYLVVLFGANDAVLDLDFTSQHVPMEQYKKNLTSIINHPPIKQQAPKILLVTPPPVNQIKMAEEDKKQGCASVTRLAATSAAYSETAREVARENPDVVLIDLWTAIMEKAISLTPDTHKLEEPWLGTPENGNQGGLEALLPDGLHMSGEAYKVFYELLAQHIDLPDDDRTGFVFPDWHVLNPVKSN